MLGSKGPDFSLSSSHDLIAKVREYLACCIKANFFSARVATAKLQIHVKFYFNVDYQQMWKARMLEFERFLVRTHSVAPRGAERAEGTEVRIRLVEASSCGSSTAFWGRNAHYGLRRPPRSNDVSFLT